MTSDHDAYGTIARIYDRILEPITSPLRSRALDVAPPAPGMRVLDVGCGTGTQLERYAEGGANVTGVDLSPAMLAVAAERLGEGADLICEDATSLSFPDGSFDLVIASLLLHELAPAMRSGVLDEMVRVTAHDGAMLVIDYRAGPRRMRGHAWRAFSVVLERLAGRTHYSNWRRYLAEGGLDEAVTPPMTVDRIRLVAGGNLAIWLMSTGLPTE
ncbi:MAG TPA: class I SAM-dependent methyltransferase [Acidimicrobiia bacterium]|nr:class I SAM-dependent methyltransferase [Acidimicrobiia bacterium]